jgi:Tol biopolymer transport system component
MSRSSFTLPVVSAAALLFAAGCGGSNGGEPELAFVTSRDGAYSIYGMGADGGHQSPITQEDVPDGSTPAKLFFQVQPAWAPDGRSIAFASDRGGSFHIFVTSVDGSGTRRLTSTKLDDTNPSWSPDGTRIAFQRGGAGDIYVMDADGRDAHPLQDEDAEETDPAWAPDGRWIAYVRKEIRSPVRELWLVRPDGTGRRKVTRLASFAFEPAWSPDSTQLAFASRAGGSNYDIFAVRLTGGRVRRLTTSPEDEFEPAWSFDGKEIAFVREGSIFVTDLKGRARSLTDGGTNDRSPVWRPVPLRR